MTPAPFAQSRPARALALMLIITAHIIVVLGWPKRTAPVSKGTMRELDIAFVTLPKSRPPAPASRVPPALPTEQPRRAKPPPVSAPAVTLIQLPAVDDTAPPAEPVPVAPRADAIVDRARRDVGAIDRELRKQSLDPALRHQKLHPGRFETAIAGAFKERGPTRIIEEVMPDGSRRSRVGNMCASMESNSLTGGRDVFRDGVKTKWAQCPQ